MKNFLDQPVQDWSKPQLPELRDILVLAFRRIGALEALAADASILEGTFPISHDVRSTCYELIRTMGDQGKLRLLVEKAAQAPTAAAYHGRIREMLDTAPALSSGGRYTAGAGEDDVDLAARNDERLMEKRSRLVPVEMAQQITAAAAAVARLELVSSGHDLGRGTGFLIAEDLLLTSYHNLWVEARDKRSVPVSSARAEFDIVGAAPADPVVRSVVIVPVAGDEEADWVALRLSDPVDREPLLLARRPGPHVNDLLVIIQHPMGGMKQFALEPLAVWDVDDRHVRYLADTQNGSSGAPVCNERMEVVAIHKGESPLVLPTGAGAGTVWRNMGVRVGGVVATLNELGISYRGGGLVS